MVLEDATLTLAVSVLATVALPVTLVLVLVACMQCLRRNVSKFTNFGSNSNNSVNNSQAHVNNTFTVDIDDTEIDVSPSTSVTIDPLPDISGKAKLPAAPLRPRMGCMERNRQDASLKMIAVHHQFPRSQIIYLKELGAAWFGKVIESDAEKISTGAPRSKVVVKMLKDDASKDEQLLFFEDVAPYREIEHKNVLRLLGQCTEMHPMLMIMEFAPFGNLKHYLRGHQSQVAALIQRNRLIQFAIDAASGLACLHRHDYLHRDLAARNCVVMGDHTLKIGDYGLAEELYKEDYLVSGQELLPIRWMAPETLKQENGKWKGHNFSKESDIWSLGVLLWEIANMGERPYDLLTDEAMLQGVIIDKDIRLPEPNIGMPNKDRIYEVMMFCWLDATERTKVDEVHALLQQISNKGQDAGALESTSATPDATMAAFEQKWEHLMPNRRERAESTEDQLDKGSVSSDDSDLLNDLARVDSLEDFTAPKPEAPPRGGARKKVSVSMSVSVEAEEEKVVEKKKAEVAAAAPVKPSQPSAKPSQPKPSEPSVKPSQPTKPQQPVAEKSSSPVTGQKTEGQATQAASARPVPTRKAPAKPPEPKQAPDHAPAPPKREEVKAEQPVKKEAPAPVKTQESKKEEQKVENTAELIVPAISVTTAAAPPATTGRDSGDFTEFTSAASTEGRESGDFTEFTSHETPDKSLDVDLFGSPDVSLVSPPVKDSAGDVTADDVFSQAKEDDVKSGTPDRPQPKGRKTSTPLVKGGAPAAEMSPASFLSALSSPSTTADTFATASDSTLVSDPHTKGDSPSDESAASMSFEIFSGPPSTTGHDSSGDMSFEIIDATAVPSTLHDFDSTLEQSKPTLTSDLSTSQDSSTSDKPTPTSAPPRSPNPFADTNPADSKDLFGDFSTSESSPPEKPTGASNQPNSTSTNDDFFSFTSESVAEAKGVEPASPQNNPFLSFGTDLSSLSSLAVSEAPADPTQAGFPSFTSQLSSLSSMDTASSSSATPQSEPQSNPFGFEQTTEPAVSKSNPPDLTSGLGDFSFETLGLDSQAPKQSAEAGKNPASSSMGGDVPGGMKPTAASELATAPGSGKQRGGVMDDLFGFGEPAAQSTAATTPTSPTPATTTSPNSSDLPDSKTSNASANPFADFDLLSGLSSAPPASSPSANPFSLEGDLLSGFDGPSSASATEEKVGTRVLATSDGAIFSWLAEKATFDGSSVQAATTAEAEQTFSISKDAEQVVEISGEIKESAKTDAGVVEVSTETGSENKEATETSEDIWEAAEIHGSREVDIHSSSEGVDIHSSSDISQIHSSREVSETHISKEVPDISSSRAVSDISSSRAVSEISSSRAVSEISSSRAVSETHSSRAVSETSGVSKEVSETSSSRAVSETHSSKEVSESSSSRAAEAASSKSDNADPEESSSSTSNTDTTDTSSTTNSDSGKDYVCDEPWGEGAEGDTTRSSSPSPPPGSPNSSADSEDMAMRIASEIYLSRGLTMARSFETPSFLEPILEDPAPLLSEESAPTPSETSSVDVKFEDVFEWDDFMGEPLVGKDRTSSESPKPSLSLCDWTMDADNESLRSAASLHSQRSSDDSAKKGEGLDSQGSGSHNTANARSCVSDSEVTAHGGAARVSKSFISDIIANRTKGLSLNTNSRTSALSPRRQNNFYSLYDDDFEFELDSQSETELDLQSDNELNAKSEHEFDPQTVLHSSSKSEQELDSKSEHELDSKSEHELDSKSEHELDSNPYQHLTTKSWHGVEKQSEHALLSKPELHLNPKSWHGFKRQSESNSKSEHEIDPQTEHHSNSRSELELDSQLEQELDSKLEQEVDSQSEHELNSVPDLYLTTKSWHGVEKQPEHAVHSKPEPHLNPKSWHGFKGQPELESNSKSEHETDPQTEHHSNSRSEQELDSQLEQELDSQSEHELDSVPDLYLTTKSWHGVERQPEHALKSNPEPHSKSWHGFKGKSGDSRSKSDSEQEIDAISNQELNSKRPIYHSNSESEHDLDWQSEHKLYPKSKQELEEGSLTPFPSVTAINHASKAKSQEFEKLNSKSEQELSSESEDEFDLQPDHLSNSKTEQDLDCEVCLTPCQSVAVVYRAESQEFVVSQEVQPLHEFIAEQNDSISPCDSEGTPNPCASLAAIYRAEEADSEGFLLSSGPQSLHDVTELRNDSLSRGDFEGSPDPDAAVFNCAEESDSQEFVASKETQLLHDLIPPQNDPMSRGDLEGSASSDAVGIDCASESDSQGFVASEEAQPLHDFIEPQHDVISHSEGSPDVVSHSEGSPDVISHSEGSPDVVSHSEGSPDVISHSESSPTPTPNVAMINCASESVSQGFLKPNEAQPLHDLTAPQPSPHHEVQPSLCDEVTPQGDEGVPLPHEAPSLPGGDNSSHGEGASLIDEGRGTAWIAASNSEAQGPQGDTAATEGSGSSDKTPGSGLLDFSDFESSAPVAAGETGETAKDEKKPSSEAGGTSLLDF